MLNLDEFLTKEKVLFNGVEFVLTSDAPPEVIAKFVDATKEIQENRTEMKGEEMLSMYDSIRTYIKDILIIENEESKVDALLYGPKKLGARGLNRLMKFITEYLKGTEGEAEDKKKA